MATESSCTSTKKSGFPAWTGDIIGASLLAALAEKGVRGHKSIVVLNDTVATLLGGKAACPDREFGSYDRIYPGDRDEHLLR